MDLLPTEKIQHIDSPRITQDILSTITENPFVSNPISLDKRRKTCDSSVLSGSPYVKIEMLESQVESLQQTNQNLSRDLSKMTQDNEKMKKYIESLEQKNAELKQKTDELGKRNNELEKENLRLCIETDNLLNNESFLKRKDSSFHPSQDSNTDPYENGEKASTLALSGDISDGHRRGASINLYESFEFKVSNSTPFMKPSSLTNAGDITAFLRNKSISDNIMDQFSFSPSKSSKRDSLSLLDRLTASDSYIKPRMNSRQIYADKSYLEGLAKGVVVGNVNPLLGDCEDRGHGSFSTLPKTRLPKKPILKFDCTEMRSRTPSMVKGFKFKPRQLFEDFFVVGVDRERISEFIVENPKAMKGSIPGKILWNFRSAEFIEDRPIQTIQDFVFPYGVKVRDITNEEHERDKLESRIFSEKERIHMTKMVFPLLPWNNDVLVGTWDPSVEQMNEHHLIYFVCVISTDYIAITPEDIQKTYPETNIKETRIFEVRSASCFMSYYPIVPFFYQLLKSTSNQLRHIRMERYNWDQRDLRKYDLISWMDLISDHLRKSLQIIYEQCPIPECGKKLEVSLSNYPQYPLASSFLIPPASEAFAVESLWGSYIVFSHFSLKDIRWLVSALLLEKKLVFISRNSTLLSATLSVLITLIKPFLYTYPIIFSIPEVLLGLCDAPGAGIMGLNQGEDYFWNQDMLNLYPSCTFVLVDSLKVYALEETKVNKMPVFQDFDVRLKAAYNEINNSSEEMKKYMTIEKIMKVKMREDLPERIIKNEISDSKKYFRSQVIFMLIRITWSEKIISLIDNELRQKNKNYDKISKELTGQYFYGANKDFLKDFVKTQILSYFFQILSSKPSDHRIGDR